MYRQRLPVGCVGIGIPYIKGVHKVYVDVRERTPDINGVYNITTGGVLSVEVHATDFFQWSPGAARPVHAPHHDQTGALGRPGLSVVLRLGGL